MDIQRGQSMVKVGDIFHRFDLSGDYRECTFAHDIWNETDQTWEQNEDIRDLGGFEDWLMDQMFQCGSVEAKSLIHVPSQNILLMFCSGSSDPGYHNLNVWRYHITKGQWTRIEGFEFSFGNGIVLTADEKYVVIVGGVEYVVDECNQEVESQDDIFVLDIQNEAEYKLWGTSIRFPQLKGSNSWTKINGAVSSGDLSDYILLTSGWVRKLFASELFVGILFPPLVIVEMTEEYRKKEETIHWIATECTRDEETREVISREENHYAVPLRHILSSMSEKPHQTEIEADNY